jgi:hypothetical protein
VAPTAHLTLGPVYAVNDDHQQPRTRRAVWSVQDGISEVNLIRAPTLNLLKKGGSGYGTVVWVWTPEELVRRRTTRANDRVLRAACGRLHVRPAVQLLSESAPVHDRRISCNHRSHLVQANHRNARGSAVQSESIAHPVWQRADQSNRQPSLVSRPSQFLPDWDLVNSGALDLDLLGMQVTRRPIERPGGQRQWCLRPDEHGSGHNSNPLGRVGGKSARAGFTPGTSPPSRSKRRMRWRMVSPSRPRWPRLFRHHCCAGWPIMGCRPSGGSVASQDT